MAGKVLWAMKSKDHFIAAPVPHGERLYVSRLGFISTATFSAVDLDPRAGKRVAWSKTAPLITQPTVSSPGVAGDRLVFGDGMHLTNGSILYCLRTANGRPLWQLPVPGELAHLEGSPTIAGGRVYLGGGSAGVLCVELDRMVLAGKEMNGAEAGKLLDAKMVELKKKYDVDKKKDPFALPPTDADLPRPQPKTVWQVGKVKWHVDAPVAVVGDRVLAASAYLDKEKLGQRTLFCLDAKNGKEAWSVPLAMNPWGGPSVRGDVVIVTGSTVSMDPGNLTGAKGVVAAYDLKTGKPKWAAPKALPGGAIACAALTPDSAIVTATDGKVRSYELASGRLRWFYTARGGFFAPAAVTADTAYAADLNGVVHAINLKTGTARWTLDLGTDPAVASPGMVYGGPIVHGGRVYVATCNLTGPNANKPTAVVCIGER